MLNNLFKHRRFTATLLTLVCCFFTSILSAQTDTLINPTKEGGFELGNGTFAANGWSVGANNATQVNQWVANRGANQGFSGNYCAYITNNPLGTPPPHAYTVQQASTVHFYRDVTFKAGKTRVLLTFSAINTTANSLLRVAIVHRDSALTTGTTLSSYVSYGYSTNYVAIDPSVIGNCGRDTTVRLVFSWSDNPNETYAQTPPAVDDISLWAEPISPLFSSTNTEFTINNTLPTSGTNFNTFKDAFTALNLNVNGRCDRSKTLTFKVSAGQVFNNPLDYLSLTASGTVTSPIIFQKNGVGANPIVKRTIHIWGGDYITFDGIDVDGRDTLPIQNLTKFGYLVQNVSPTNGAQNITIKNCTITLDDRIKSIYQAQAIGILQTTYDSQITSQSGTNSFNKFLNVNIFQCDRGIWIRSNPYLPDSLIEIGTTDPAKFAQIGLPEGEDITQNSIYTEGVKNLTIHHISSGMPIYVSDILNNTRIYNNKIITLKGRYALSIRGYEPQGTTDAKIEIFNNFFSLPRSTVRERGSYGTVAPIFTDIYSYNTTLNFYNNSLLVNETQSISDPYAVACLRFVPSGLRFRLVNNIFANATRNSKNIPNFCILGILDDNSISNHNAFWRADTATKIGGLTSDDGKAYSNLNDWRRQRGSNITDANSVEANPDFLKETDLHAYGTGIDGKGTAPLSNENVDIDNEPRTAPFDIGADQFTRLSTDLAVLDLVEPNDSTLSICDNRARRIKVLVKNLGSQTINFAQNAAIIRVILAKPNKRDTFSTTFNTGTLAVDSSRIFALDSFVTTVGGTYTFQTAVSTVGDLNRQNDSASFERRLIAPRNLPIIEGFETYFLFTDWTFSANTGFLNRGKPGNGITSVLSPTKRTQSFILPKVGTITDTSTLFSIDYRIVSSFNNALPSNCKIEILASTDCGATFSVLKTIDSTNHPRTIAFQSIQLPLSNFKGKDVVFKVNMTATSAQETYVDFDNIYIGAPCQKLVGMDTISISINTPLALRCVGSATDLTPKFASPQSFGTIYQWQYSSDTTRTWRNISNFNPATTNITAVATGFPIYYRLKTTCTTDGTNRVSNNLLIKAVNTPPIAKAPFKENFENWQTDSCAVPNSNGIPSTFFTSVPNYGQYSWHRNDEGERGGWQSYTSGAYTPQAASGQYSARFHSYGTGSYYNSTTGRLDVHIDLSGATDKQLAFDYINTDGGDGLKVLLSADGGITFTQIDTPLNVSTTWRRFKYNLPANGSSTSVLRLEGNTNVVPDYSTNGTDIGLDSLTVNAITTAPACTVVSTPQNGATDAQADQLLTWQAADFATGYRIKIGTTANASDVLALTDIGAPTQYRFPNFYDYQKKYFVTLEPYNRVGATQNCPSSSFTTGKNNNFGGGRDGVDSLQLLSGGYSFANSTTNAATAPLGRATYTWVNPLTHSEVTDFGAFNGDGRDNGSFGVADIGFIFPFYSNQGNPNNRSVALGINGVLSTDYISSYYPTKSIPSWDSPNRIMAACHADLYKGEGSRLFYKSDSTQFVATWWHFYASTAGVPDTSEYITFQVILKPDGSIKYQYNASESSVGSRTNSKINQTALIGVEGYGTSGIRGIQYRNKGIGARLFDAQNKPLAIVFEPSKGDLEAFEFVNLTNNQTCFTTILRPVVKIRNAGIVPLNLVQTPITVQLKMTGVRTQTFTRRVDTGTIAPNAFMDITFLSPLSIDTNGVYNFDITVKNPLDDNPSNDTFRTSRTIDAKILGLPYSETFNAASTTRNAWNSYGSSLQQFRSGNDGDYTRLYAQYSESTFPTPAFGRMRKGDHIAFDFRIVSPFTDKPEAAIVGNNWGKIIIEYSNECGENRKILDSITATAHTPTLYWRQKSVKLPDSLAGQHVNFFFKAYRNEVAYALDIDNFYAGYACDSVNFDIGNITAPPSVCLGDTARAGLFQRSLAPNIKYQWQQSLNNGTTWSAVAAAEGNNYFLPPTLATREYRAIGTCTLNQKMDTSDKKLITAFTPQYAALPYTQSFESWQTSTCNFKPFSTNDIPDASWLSLPQFTSSSWRRHDEGNLGRWTNAASGITGASSSEGLYFARFHSSDSYSMPLAGSLNLFVDLSGTADKTLAFNYFNRLGNDSLRVWLSTDGGGTFRLLSTLGTVPIWTTITYNIPDGTAKSVIRFEGICPYTASQDDLVLDYVRVFANNFTVDAAVTSVVSPTGFGCQNSSVPIVVKIRNAGVNVLNLATNPVTVSATISGSIADVIGKTLDTGRLAVGESRDITLAPNFNLTAAGIYNFDFFTACAKDSNTVNNTLKTQLRVISSQTVPFFETFDASPNFPLGWLTEGGARMDTSWQRNGAFSIGFIMTGQASPNGNFIGTGGSFTLPKIGIIRAEDLLAFDFRIARFNTPIPQGVDWGSVEGFISDDCGQTWTSVWTSNGNNFTSSVNFINVRIPLSRWAGKSIITRFVATYKSDSYKIEFDYFRIDKKCSGAPTIAAITGNATLCYSEKATLNTTVGTGIGLNWIWQKLEGTRWTGIDTNKTQFTSQPLFAPTSYRVVATCLLDSMSRIGNPFNVTVSQPVYATLPYFQDFESWLTPSCTPANSKALPDASWIPQYYTGNASWRRNDQGALANWIDPNSGTYRPLSTTGSYSARLHATLRPVDEPILLDLHVDLSTLRGVKYLAFDHIGVGNSLVASLSTDGGKTFNSFGGIYSDTSWQRSEFAIQSDSARAIIRFYARGQWGVTTLGLDIGLDNLTINSRPMPNCAQWIMPTPYSNNILSDVTLRWRSSANAKGYRIKIGTTQGGSEFLPLTDVGRDTFYKPANKLGFLTTYFATLYAYDSSGNGRSNCFPSNFTVQRNPNFGGGPSGNDPTQLRSGGYFFANSTSAAVMALPSQPSYRWIDPLSSSHQIITNWTSGNDNNGSFTLPDIGFNFSYFGTNYRTNIFVNSNGALHFGAPNAANGASEYIPSQGNNNNFIAGCWMDLAAGTDGKVYHGRSPNGDYVVTWWHFHDVEQNGVIDTAEYITFQIILNPNGTVKVQFNDTESTADDGRYFDILNDALVGIENADGTQGIQYRNEGGPAPMFSSPLAVAFALNDKLLPVEKPLNTEGVIVGTVFPNPSSGLFSYDFFTPQSRVLKLTLSNSLGQTVWSDTQQSASGWQQKTIDGQHLPSSVYWLRVTTGEGKSFLQKVVKH